MGEIGDSISDLDGFVPNEPNIQCETNLQAKEIEVRGLGDY